MNVTVIGATGRTGTHLLDLAAQRGHRITALTRSPGKLARADTVARLVAGDGRDPAAVREATTGADAVIAILAPRSPRGPHQIAEVARVLTAAMTDLDVSRLVITSAYPLVARTPRLPLAVLRVALAGTYADLAQMERVVSGSGLAWTIVRLNRLINAPRCGGTRISPGLLEKASAITRADAAAVLLDIAKNDALSRTSVNVTGPGRPRGRTRTEA